MPLSQSYHFIPINRIIVEREERQRREFTGIEDLAKSIQRRGLIHPLVVTRKGILVTGERRLEALKSLGWLEAPVQWLDELEPGERRAIELEENIKRQSLTWQERTRAVSDYHKLRKSQDSGWTIEKTAVELTMSPGWVDSQLWVQREIDSGNTAIAECSRFSAALGLCQRKFERDAADAGDFINLLTNEAQRDLEEVLELDEGSSQDLSESFLPEDSASSAPIRWSVTQGDFFTLASNWTGEKFNLIHFDPPYGVNRQRSKYSEGGASRWESSYDDTPEQFFLHLDCLLQALPRLCQVDCHILLWHSMNFRLEIEQRLRQAGVWYNPWPLVWGKGNTGIISDPRRRPRHVYETCLQCCYGDRPLVRSLADLVNYSPENKDRSHYSEKPEVMLTPFLSMFVDGSTILLDPTCGSGSALKVAQALGAKRVVGWDLDSLSVEMSVRRLKEAQDGWLHNQNTGTTIS